MTCRRLSVVWVFGHACSKHLYHRVLTCDCLLESFQRTKPFGARLRRLLGLLLPWLLPLIFDLSIEGRK